MSVLRGFSDSLIFTFGGKLGNLFHKRIKYFSILTLKTYCENGNRNFVVKGATIKVITIASFRETLTRNDWVVSFQCEVRSI